MDGKKIVYCEEIWEDESVTKNWWEIPRGSIEIGEKLGSGAFGEVKKSHLTIGNKTEICAVKMLKGKV